MPPLFGNPLIVDPEVSLLYPLGFDPQIIYYSKLDHFRFVRASNSVGED